MANCVGIDLGTTNSCIAFLENNAPVVIPNQDGGMTTPSVVAFVSEDEKVVGQMAKRQAVTNPECTFSSMKRLIGQRYESEEVQRTMLHVAYPIVASPKGDAWVEHNSRLLAPEQIASEIIYYIKESAEGYLGEPISDAVITVPAYFNDSQRQATKDAGKLAGLNVLRIINEPTAAALAYGYGEEFAGRVAVYDLGGGTFDISILEVESGVFQVLATSGDTFLGGEDFDQAIVNSLADSFLQQYGVDLRDDPMALQRLREAAESAKCDLSTLDVVEIHQPFIATDAQGTPLHLVEKMHRADFEELVQDLVERTLEPCQDALNQAGIDNTQVDALLLVGGQTRSPIVKRTAEAFFAQKIAKFINPDEVVAKGACIQAGVLQGDVKDIMLLDVIPLSIGVETRGGIFRKLIERNSTIPTEAKEIFTTVINNQKTVDIKIYQGEAELCESNLFLEKLELVNIPPAPRGIPQIEVTFSVDANGLLEVGAMDRATGVEQSLQLTPSGGLSADEISEMVDTAETDREENKSKKEVILERNKLDSLLETVSKSLKNQHALIGHEQRKAFDETVEMVRAERLSADVGSLKESYQQLAVVAQTLTEMLMLSEDSFGLGEDDGLDLDDSAPQITDNSGSGFGEADSLPELDDL